MNISYPNKTSKIYKQFVDAISVKVTTAMLWLNDKNIEFCHNYEIDNHLYRIYIPQKDVLLDFEWYPINNPYYNYVRINYDTDVIDVMEKLFPETEISTQDAEVWILKRKASNKFLRDNGHSPIYDKNVLRLAWVKDMMIYQCIVLKNNRIIANVVKQNHAVPYGTYILLRYINEMLGIENILIKENSDSSYSSNLYQILGLPIISKSPKRKIWWSPNKAVWRTNHPENYVPFYLTETITYSYPKESP